MNNKLKALLIAICIVILFGGSYFFYGKLSKNQESLKTPSQSVSESNTDSNPTVSSSPSEASNKAAPNFTVYNSKGEKVSLKDYIGKPVVVNFWASWCGPCKSEMPHFEAAYKKYDDKIEFLMVNLTGGGNDTKANADKLISSSGYTFPVYYDTDNSAAYAYSIRSMPMSCFVNEKGELVGQTVGAISAKKLESYISQILPQQ